MVLLLRLKGRTWQKSALSLRPDKLVRNLSYLAVIGIFFFGGYLFFHRIFVYLAGVELIGAALTQKILQTSFLVFFTMLFMSNAVSSLSTFFRSEEVHFLFSRPFPPETIFSQKFAENLFYSSWATLMAGVPILLAYGVSQSAPAYFYPISLLALLLFILIPAGLGVSVLILVIRFIPRVRRRELVLGLAGLIVVIAAVGIGFRGAGGFRIPVSFELAELGSFVGELRVASPLLPSTWMVGALVEASGGRGKQLLLYLLILLSSGALSLVLALFTASRVYLGAWFRSSESPARYGRARRRRLFTTGQRLALVEKDIKLFLRDPSQWSQALILFALLAVYVISLKRTPIYFDSPFWLTVIFFLNLGFVGYILATLSIRFVFPTISLEGATSWILKSSPISVRNLFFGKLSLNLAIGLVLAETLVVTTSLFLGVEPCLLFVSVVCVAFFTVSIVSLSVGLGGVFPDFKEGNPSRIASGPGGVLTAIFSLVYVGLCISLMAWPAHAYLRATIARRPFPLPPFLISGVSFLGVNLLYTILPLGLGMRCLARREL